MDTPPAGPTLYLDADACPVKPEAYRVAARYAVPVRVVANAHLNVPAGVELVVVPGFGGADDWIAATCRPGDAVVTADVPLAARCVAAGADVVDPRGRRLTDASVHDALAARDLSEALRQAGQPTGGPAPFGAKDRSRFLSTLDGVLSAAVRRRAT